MVNNSSQKFLISKRFRSYYPVVIDVETGGLDPKNAALLEIAVVSINCNDQGILSPGEIKHHHVLPFEGAKLDPDSLKINKIDPFHPFRFAIPEKEALEDIFDFIKKIQKEQKCTRSVLVGHNAWFDLAFINAAINRTKIKKNPLHAFTCFDTATLAALTYGQTVLAQAIKKAKIPFSKKDHHSAKYDTKITAELFCNIVNQWPWPD